MTSHVYEVFGGRLRSELPLEELPMSTSASADWTLRVVDGSLAPEGELLGTDTVFGDTQVRGFRSGDGLTLVFDDTGRFDVSADGSVITWHRPPDVVLEAAHADITSRVLALALHAGGVFALHASAVSIHGAGVAFLAPKYHGKSTLCSALVLAGARALSDDTVPVRTGDIPRLSPGLPRLRLWSDTAARLFGVDAHAAEAPRKHVMDQLAPEQVETDTVPFRAAYVLNPVTELPEGAVAARDRLDTVAATMSLVMHAKLGPVLAGAESPVVLSRAAEIARVVPVYALHIVRDLARVDEVARQLFAWHAGDGQ
ncbi:MAG TPA: hypothetical protein VFZ73_14165 [Gemmatimonadaceae bacterium]